MDVITNLLNLKNKLTTQENKTAFADFSEELRMPEVVTETFRIFQPHKPEKNRVDNGLPGAKFDIYKDTLMDYPSIIQSKLGNDWALYNKLLSCQVALCDFHCWHCYVPDDLLAGGKGMNFLSPVELVDRFLAAKNDSTKLSYGARVLRISGGEPFLAIDLILESLEYIHDLGLENEIFIWSETNLSPFLKNKDVSLAEEWLKQKNRDLNDFHKYNNFALHPCIHGTTPANFKQITLADEKFFDGIIDAFKLLINAHIDIFPTFGSNVSPSNEINSLFDRLKSINNKLPLRFALIKFDFEGYPAIDERLSRSGRYGTFYGKNAIISKWDNLLRQNYAVGYAEVPRKDIKLW